MSMRSQLFGITFVVAASVGLVACAAGMDNNIDDDDPIDARRIDASQVVDAPLPTDARVIDAPQVIDAPIAVDAAPMGTVPTGGACTVSTECAVAGDCCVFGKMTCQPGTEPIPGFCFPN